MVRFQGFQETVLAMLEQLQLTQPQLDTKPATVARDLFIDPQAQQIAEVHDLLREISGLQSIANLTGDDLTNFGFNFGATRQTGTRASGQVVFTFRSLTSDLSIPAGTVVSTRNGVSFATISNVSVRTSDINSLRATAARLREQLDTVGITDTLAVEATVEAQSSGSSGNIASYSVVNHNAPSANAVTNTASFSGGSDLETDSSFRSRILATFAGANTGTALGYRSLVLALPDAVDALVAEPGDTVMTRDGTVTSVNDDGETVVTQPGTGGKVDIYVLGENLQPGTDSFIYKEASGTGDPTDPLNDFVLGQGDTSPDTIQTLNSRRVSVLSEGTDIPNQPVSDIVSVTGSSSGNNFVEQFTDEDGVLQGNYKLVKDTGAAAGSPFGLDKLVWTSDRINLADESATKGPVNGVDALSFTDVLSMPGIRQDVRVLNENSRVSSSDRSIVSVFHTPVRTVSRVFNLTTGERYTITDQNPDGDTGDLNQNGRIEISGRTLPTASDVLQVDYIWTRELDAGLDFDSLDPKDPVNESQDSVDWGFSNYVRYEPAETALDAYGNLSVTVEYPVDRILSVNTFVQETLTVAPGTTSGQKTVTTSEAVINVLSIKDESRNGIEVYGTLADDGTFSNKLITLPSDTLAQVGDTVEVTYSLRDLVDQDGYDSASILNRKITILPSTAAPAGTDVLVSYVMEVPVVLPETDLDDLPLAGDGYNSFVLEPDGYQPFLDAFSGGEVVNNRRRSPSQLAVEVSGIPVQGILELVGTTFNRVDATFVVTADGSIDLAPLIRAAEGLGRTATVPTSVFLARVVSLESVTTDSATGAVSVVHEFDLTNYALWSNRFDLANAVKDTALRRTALGLAPTEDNTDNDPVTGTNLRVSFYYAKQNDSERLFFSKAGTAYTDKRFAKLDSVARISGFANSAGTVSGSFSVDTFNQPAANAAYLVDYDYTAPKENERITVNYEYNKLIQDATFAIEDGRPITADVLAKEAVEITVDVTASIIVLPAFVTSEDTVKQDVADNISASLNAGALGTTLDRSDVENNAYAVEGLDRIVISRFNKSDTAGTVESVSAAKNEHLVAGTVTVTVESR